MRRTDILSLGSHLLNFAIILYFVSFLINIEQIRTFDLFISFFGLFASLIANIYSLIERNKRR